MLKKDNFLFNSKFEFQTIIKLRRSLAAQQRARAKEALSQTKTLQAGMMTGKKALQVAAHVVVADNSENN